MYFNRIYAEEREENDKFYDKDMNIISDEEGRVWNVASVLDDYSLLVSINDDTQEIKDFEEFANKNYKA